MYSIENKQYPCSTSLTMKYIGGKWKAVILIHLIKKKRYSELRKECMLITERTLSLQLKELEADALIVRKEYPQVPPKVEYFLSSKGVSLIPVLNTLCEWGERHRAT